MADRELEQNVEEKYDSEAILGTDDWDDGLILISADSTINLLDAATPLADEQSNGAQGASENGNAVATPVDAIGESAPTAEVVAEPEPEIETEDAVPVSEPEVETEDAIPTTEPEAAAEITDELTEEPPTAEDESAPAVSAEQKPMSAAAAKKLGVAVPADEEEDGSESDAPVERKRRTRAAAESEDSESDAETEQQPMSAAAAKKLGVKEDVTTRSEDGSERRVRPPRRTRRARKASSATRRSRHFNADNPPETTDWDDIEEGQIPYVSPQAPVSRKFRHYIETRWFPQWKYYDERASMSKKRYIRYQIFIALGSVAVPIIIGFNFVPQWVPAVISGGVAAAAAIENVMKYGDNWRAYRAAAEGLNREKVLFEAMSGPYATATAPLRMFVERCEDVIAEETGRFFERNQEEPEDGDVLESDVSSAGGE